MCSDGVHREPKRRKGISHRNKRDFRPPALGSFDIVAVAGDAEFGAPFYLVNRPSQTGGESSVGQFFGKPLRSEHFVGPYSLAWDDGKGKEVQSNLRPVKCSPVLNEDHELIIDGVQLDRHGFLRRFSAQRIANALPSDCAKLVPPELLGRALDSDADDGSDTCPSSEDIDPDGSDEDNSASALEGDADEASTEKDKYVEEDSAGMDNAETKAVEFVAPAAGFATYEEKMKAEVQALPKTRRRATRKL